MTIMKHHCPCDTYVRMWWNCRNWTANVLYKFPVNLKEVVKGTLIESDRTAEPIMKYVLADHRSTCKVMERRF